MIADFLRKGLAWARGFFWVSDSDTKQQTSRGDAASGSTGTAKAQRASEPTAAPKSTAQRRPAEAKTSTNKRGTDAAKRTTSKAAGPASRTAAGKGAGKTAGDKSPSSKGPSSKGPSSKGPASKSAARKSTATKSTGPGAPEADPAKPGDLSEIKGIGPAMKAKLAQLGIGSFADLAGADADQVAKSLDQRTITPERVRSWIAEAKKRS
jgi:predicted flap endonuclease-1-like 5' DNA nuclease